ARFFLRSGVFVVLFGAFFFLPGGSLHYWQGWAFMGLWFLPMVIVSPYFLKHDPQLVERRLQTKEKSKEQKMIIRMAQPIVFLNLLVPGLDYRSGWSRVPIWLTIVSEAFVLSAYVITFSLINE